MYILRNITSLVIDAAIYSIFQMSVRDGGDGIVSAGKAPPVIGFRRYKIVPETGYDVLTDVAFLHDDVIKWKHFPCYWNFVWGIHRSPVTQRPVTRSFYNFL